MTQDGRSSVPIRLGAVLADATLVEGGRGSSPWRARTGLPEPAAARQLLLATAVLGAEQRGAGLDLLRDVLQPWLGVVAAATVAAPALVVVQVLAVGVPLGDAIDPLALLDVPAHEVQGVGEVVAAGAPAAGLALVVGPGLVLGLGVAVGGADPAPGDETEEVVARRQGVVLERRFLVHHRHRHLDRRAPALLHLQRRLVPFRFFAEDLAEVVGIGGGAWWRSRQEPGAGPASRAAA